MSKANKYLKEQKAKKKQRATQAFREGKGRIKEDSSAKREARGVNSGLGTGGEGKVAGSAGTRGIKSTRGGNTTRVVTEKGANAIKKKGLVDKSSKLKNTGRLVKKADGTLSSTTRPKAKSVVAKKKKEKAKNKEPLNYGTPMNYSMKPGSREKDSPGAFRDTAINKYMGSGINYGTEGDAPLNDGHDKKRKLGTEGMTADQKVAYYKKQSENMKKKKSSSNKAPRGPQNISAGGVKGRATIKGQYEKNTDLLEEGKKVYKKVKKYFSS
jgi:hypothetical protein